MLQNLILFAQQNPGKIAALLGSVYEVFVRIRPTNKNWSLIDAVFKLVSYMIPNSSKITTVKKDQGLTDISDKHITVVKMIALFLLISSSSFGQLNSTFKAARSYNADSLTVKTEVQGLQLMYDSLVGSLYYNSQHNPGKWRIFYNSAWHDLISKPGSSINFGLTKQIPFMNTTNNNFLYSADFLFNGPGNQLIGGGGSTAPAGSQTITWGDHNINNGAFGSALFGEVSEIAPGVGSALSVGEGNYINGYGGIAFGRGVKAQGAESFAGGRYVAGVSAKTNPKAPQSTGIASFSWYITDTNQPDNNGNQGFASVILGGRNHQLPPSAQFSVILGGNKMTMNADTSMVYVPNFRNRSAIGTGTRMVVADPNGYYSTQTIPAGSTPGAPVNSIQFNSASTFAGSAAFTYLSGANEIRIATGTNLRIGNVGSNTIVSNENGDNVINTGNYSILTNTPQFQLGNSTGTILINTSANDILIGNNGVGTGNVKVRVNSGTSQFFIVTGLPTTCAGAPTGALANIAGVLNICP